MSYFEARTNLIHLATISMGRCRSGLVCIAGALGVMLFFASQASAATTYKDIVINVQPLPRVATGTAETDMGYLEYRITITNKSNSKSHTVGLELPQNSYGNSRRNHIRQIQRYVKVEPAQTVVVSLLQPPVQMQGNGIGVRIDGSYQSKSLDLPRGEHGKRGGGGYGSSSKNIAVLVTRTIDRELHKQIADSSSSSSSSSGSGMLPGGAELSTFVSEADVRNWSTNWLGYTRYQGVAITDADAKRMPPEVMGAIKQYVEAGGTLIVMGQWTIPDEWGNSVVELDGAMRQITGRKSIRKVQSSPGFGSCIITQKPFKATLSSSIRDQIRQQLRASGRLVSSMDISIRDANKQLPVVDELAIPARGMFILMLIFAILIGPINLIALAKMHKSMWLFWTVPFISLTFCGVIVVYNVIAEGWSPKARSISLTLLDQQTNRATTLGEIGYYSPLTPGGGLHFAIDTELSPMYEVTWRGRESTRSRTMNWSIDQHLESGWVVARVPAHFLTRRCQTAQRIRVELLRNSDGSLSVRNGLGEDIEELYIADDKGKIYHFKNLPAGENISIANAKRAGQSRNQFMPLRKIFDSTWSHNIDEPFKNPEQYLKPNTYIAKLKKNPFVQDGLSNLRDHQQDAFVFGIMKREVTDAH